MLIFLLQFRQELNELHPLTFVVAMILPAIGRYAVLQGIVSMCASTPLAAADLNFRGSSRYRTIDSCVSFTTKSTCLAGTGRCAWHPHSGCKSSLATVHTTDGPSPLGGEGGYNGDYESRLTLTVPRKLQTTRGPTRKPTTRKPIVSRPRSSF